MQMDKVSRGPYESDKRLAVDHNTKVDVQNSSSNADKSSPVVCRHFAQAFVEAPKKNELVNIFTDREGVKNHFNSKLDLVDQAHMKYIREAQPQSKQVLSGNQLGEYLASLAEQLEKPGGPSEADSILLTEDHAMAIHVQRKKDKETGADYLVAKLYDPNDTNTYKRVVVASPKDLKNLTIERMLVSPQLASQYRFFKPSLPMVAVCRTDGISIANKPRPESSPENMMIALKSGAIDEVRAMIEDASPEPAARFALLQANSSDLSSRAQRPGANGALQDGHADTCRLFFKTVIDDPLLNGDQKAELLAAKGSDGIPGALFALQQGHADTVKAFAEAVLGSNLGAEKKVELLAAKGSDGLPGASVALDGGHADTVTAFAQAVLSSNLDAEKKFELLAAKASNGLPGALRALKNGHADTVKAFAQEVLSSNLDAEKKVELLAAKGSGVPGAYLALQEGHADTVKAFAQAVLGSELDDNGKFELLAAKNNGTHGACNALSKGHTDTVKAFAQAVLNSNLGAEKKVELLAAKAANGLPGVTLGVLRGHTEAVAAFTQAVSSSKLGDKEKAKLLEAIEI